MTEPEETLHIHPADDKALVYSATLKALIDRAFEHALLSIDGGAGPLIPFVLTERGLTRIVGEGALDRARTLVGEQSGEIGSYAITAEALLTLEDGTKADAIIVEAGEKQIDDASVWARFIDRNGKAKTNERIFIKLTENVFPRDAKRQAPPDTQLEDYLVALCMKCQGANRVPLARVLQRPKCGECGTSLIVSRGPR
jgi:hypothetical protein